VRRARLVGSGRRLQLKITSTGFATDFSIARLYVSGVVSDEREPNARLAPDLASPSPFATRGVGR